MALPPLHRLAKLARGPIGLASTAATVALIGLTALGFSRAFSPRAPAGAPKVAQNELWPIVKPLKASGIYAEGERLGWTFSLPANPPPGIGHYTYTAKRDNGKVIGTGSIDVTHGDFVVSFYLRQPQMVYFELNSPGASKPLAFGAAVAPTKLAPAAPRPADFDDFWQGKINWLHTVPENPVLTPGDSGLPDVEWGTIKMDHVNGTHVYGQYAKPKKPGKYPAMVILQWASPPYPLDKNWVLYRAQQGWLVLNIEPHDTLANAPKSYYDALPEAIKHYASIGQDDRDKSYFLEMYLRDYRAVDYITHSQDWDGRTLVVTGGSMGGQQSLCVSGLHPAITHVIVNEPAGCDLNGYLAGRQVGYPFFPANDPKVASTARYFDCVNFASRIKATCLVAMGFLDTIAPPTGIWTAFNQIKGPKEAAPMTEAPHNNIATQEQQKPYNSRAEEWLTALVHGGAVTVNPATAQP
jgi:cephalosporin-C deacetylase-like acetyl esterase